LEKVSAPITSTRLACPRASARWRWSGIDEARADRLEVEGEAAFMPSECWIMVAAEGKVRSGVEVATITASTSDGSRPAMARRPRRLRAHARGRLARRREVPPLDARALADPFVRGVEPLRELGIRAPPARAGNARRPSPSP
jgi:hypothetical protein